MNKLLSEISQKKQNENGDMNEEKSYNMTSGLIQENMLCPWQLEAYKKAISSTRMLVLAKPGEGKTRVALMTANHFLNQGQCNGIILAVLRRKAFYDLVREVSQVGSSWGWTVTEDPKEIVYGKKYLLTISADQLHKYVKQITKLPIKFIYVDELWLFANCKSRRSRSLRKIVDIIRGPRIGVSGTIMPTEDNTTIWSQAWAMCLERCLAANLTEFRTKYQLFSIEQIGRLEIPKRQNKPGSNKKILEKLAPYSFVHFPKSTRQLHHKICEVPITKEQKTIISSLKNKYYYEDFEIRSAPELAIRIQQISNGYLPDKTFPSKIRVINGNKLVAIKQAIEPLFMAGEQVLVWCAFKMDLDLLENNLDCRVGRLEGGKAFDIVSFERGDFPVVLGTMGSGSSINHFRNIRYVKIFSSVYGWTNYDQSMGRTDRKDGMHPDCHYEHFHTKDTVDDLVYRNAITSGATEKEFIRQFERWLKNSTEN